MRVRGQVSPERVAELDRLVASHTTTEKVLRGLEAHGLRFHDIVSMDEYTLDLVVALPDGLWLVYDTT